MQSSGGDEVVMRIIKASAMFLGVVVFGLQVAPQLTVAQTAVTLKDYFVNAQLPYHNAVLDPAGWLLAWYQPEKNMGYDNFVRMDWEFLEHKVPLDKVDGVKVYLVHPVYDVNSGQGKLTMWQHNPPSTFAHLMDMFVGYYPYSGDTDAADVMREMLDYQLAHGTTPGDWAWPGVPFPTSCIGDKEYGHCLQDVPREFYGGIETDKIGELGLSYIQFYEFTGERKYLDAGIRCGDQLAKHIRPGDATHTPWPFRIDAHTGTVIDGEEFGGMIVAPVRLFDELVKLEAGGTAEYKKARDIAWEWILKNPLNKASAAWDKWSGYYEDQPKDTENVNDMDSMLVAYYILSQDDPARVDPNWRVHVRHLIDRSRLLLGRGPFFGAWGIDEQLRPDDLPAGGVDQSLRTFKGALLGTDNRGCCTSVGLVCRTSQWGAINAMFFDRTSDGQAFEDAFRSLNYATYFQRSNGAISCCGLDFDEYWFEDGHSDAGRSFMWALGAVPAFAPVGQSHLLRSSSIVKRVKYANRLVEYTTFDDSGVEVFRLNFKPTDITAGKISLRPRNDLAGNGYTIKGLAGGDYEVRLRRSGATHTVLKG
jgi:hypothetical protein